MRLPFGISVKVNSKEQTTERSGASQQRLRLRNERTYPRVSLSWGRADRLPLIKRVINSAQVNASFESSEASEGEGSLMPGHLLSEETKTEFRASWNGRWRWGPTTTIERVISTSESRDFEPTATGDGAQPLRGTRDKERVTTTFKITHNLKPRRLPLIGRLKSDVTLNLEQKFEGETRSIATGDEERVPQRQRGPLAHAVVHDLQLQHELPRRGADSHREQQRPPARQDAKDPRGAAFGHVLSPLSMLLSAATGDIFVFNQREQRALIGLTAALLIGMLVAASDWHRPSHSEEFSVVPRAVAPPPLEEVVVKQGPLSLNSATIAELVALPAIGPTIAERIVAFRRERGPFERLEQLTEVNGIGAKTLEKLRPLLTVE